jgi:hypothetical protein
MTGDADPTKMASFSFMEASPDLIPVDENFGDTNSAVETGEEDFVSKPTLDNTINDIAAANNNDDHQNNNNNNNNNNTNDNYHSFMDLTILYLTLFMVCLRRSMLNAAQFFRTLIVGQLVHLEDISHWMSEKSPSSWWQQALWQPSKVVVTTVGIPTTTFAGKYFHAAVTGDPHVWPPPAFTALALLTLVALVIHPDGFTWIMLGKLRYV